MIPITLMTSQAAGIFSRTQTPDEKPCWYCGAEKGLRDHSELCPNNPILTAPDKEGRRWHGWSTSAGHT